MSRFLRRFPAIPLCAVALTACEAPTVPLRDIPYDFVYDGFAERVIYRWPDGEKIGVYVVPTNDPARAGLLEAALRHTANAWNDAILYGEYEIVAAELEQADVILAWANESLPVDTDACPPAPGGAAWTTFCADNELEEIAAYPLTSGQHREDGVHMIVQAVYSPASADLLGALVAHEFGHVLGIGTHPCDLAQPGCPRGPGANESLMFEGIPQRSTPSAADRETVELLYRTRPDLTP